MLLLRTVISVHSLGNPWGEFRKPYKMYAHRHSLLPPSLLTMALLWAAGREEGLGRISSVHRAESLRSAGQEHE